MRPDGQDLGLTPETTRNWQKEADARAVLHFIKLESSYIPKLPGWRACLLQLLKKAESAYLEARR